jgi:2,4-dienoyl-CoA reductase-like NADH-dependent reductase (Old Yellow Enzyme family)
MSAAKLFEPLSLARGPAMKNRFMLAPLTNCQSHPDGRLSDEEFHWLTMRAEGGFALTMTCASHVQARGQGFPGQLGIFGDEHLEGLTRLASAIRAKGSIAAVQLHHAGNRSPKDLAGDVVCPSDDPATGARALTLAEVEQLRDDFIAAAKRAEKAGFDGVEIHGAHGYLINQFLSSSSNKRTDRYGGSRENRMRFALEVTDAVRAAWPEQKPLFMRISAIDGVGGWEVEDSQVLATELVARGVDLIHVSSGGFAQSSLKPGPLYQVPLSKAVRETGAKTIAVGLIDDPRDAEAILERGEADLVAFARTALEDPNWPIHAERVLDGASYELWPIQARDRIRGKDRVLGRLK